ncbi:MAG: TIGR03545 family protein, partial [Gammaproteobacteria bacterium]
RAWLGKLKFWYDQLAPMLAGSEGSDGDAAEPDTTDYSDGLPKFLVRHLRISGEVPLMNQAIPVEGDLRDLTHQPEIYGKPAELALKSASAALGNLALDAVLDHTRPKAGKDLFRFDLADLPVEDLPLGDSDKLPVIIEAAKAAINGQAVIEGGTLNLDSKVVLAALKTQVLRQEGLSKVQEALVAALGGIESLDLQVLAQGALEDPKVSLKSTLDRVLSSALKGALESEVKKLRSELNNKLNALAAEKIGALNTATGPLAGLDGLLKDQLGQLGGLSGLL